MIVRLLGIDPGLQKTGWGMISCEGSRLRFMACGVIQTFTTHPLSQRLCIIHQALLDIIQQHAPHEAAIEETFVNRDPQSALKLGQARGVAYLAPALSGLPVSEYAANLVKKTITGSGHAEKTQVAAMIRILLPLSNPQNADASDALAVAVCHAHHRGIRSLTA